MKTLHDILTSLLIGGASCPLCNSKLEFYDFDYILSTISNAYLNDGSNCSFGYCPNNSQNNNYCCSYAVSLLISKYSFAIEESFYLDENYNFIKTTDNIHLVQAEEFTHINELEFLSIKTNKINVSKTSEEYCYYASSYSPRQFLDPEIYFLKNLSYPIDKNYLLKKIKMMSVF